MEVNVLTAAVAVLLPLSMALAYFVLFFDSTKADSAETAAMGKFAGKKAKADTSKPKKTAQAPVSNEEAPKQGAAKKEIPSKPSEDAKQTTGGDEGASHDTKKKKKNKNKNKNKTKAAEGDEEAQNSAPTPTVKSIIAKSDDAAIEPPRADIPKKKKVESVVDDETRRRKQQEEEDKITALNLAKLEYAAFEGGKGEDPSAAAADAGWGIAGQKKKKKKHANANLVSSDSSSSTAAALATASVAIATVAASGPPKDVEKASTNPTDVPPALSDSLGLAPVSFNDNSSTTTTTAANGGVVLEVASTPTEVSKSVKIESKRLGMIIGPKGVTKIAIQDATNTEIRTPRLDPVHKDKERDRDPGALVDVEVVGRQDWEVNAAIKAVKDMATKGYCALLAGDNFSEGSISVHSTFLPELIGKGGGVLRTLQNHYNVKITVPQVARDALMDCKVMVVGDKKDVKRAKECIKVLCKYHHTEITHPGMCHDEMELDSSVHGYIIGYKGSEIHHIQKNYKVSIHIPGPHSLHENILVVGEPEDVRRAVLYIAKVVEKALEPKKSAEELIAEEASAAVVADQDEEVLEPWMEAYVKKGGSSNVDFSI